jgi:hypothetical protein
VDVEDEEEENIVNMVPREYSNVRVQSEIRSEVFE